MAVITMPAGLIVNRQMWGQKPFNLRFQNGDTGAGQSRILAPSRWITSLSCQQEITPAMSAVWRAMVLALQGQVNQLAVYDIINAAPAGTLRGSLVLTAAAAAGANTLSLQARRARINLLNYSDQFDNAAWFKANVTVTPNAVSDPLGGNLADAIVRTASGNNYIVQVATLAATGKTFTFSVWLRSGSLTGNVALFLRDQNGTNQYATTIVTLTPAWQRFTTTGASPVATGVQAYIDPVNDTGAAGDTFYAYGAQLEVADVATNYQQTLDAATYDAADYNNATKTLLAGDWLGIGGGSQRQLVSVSADVTTDASGAAVVSIAQPARYAQAAGASVIWDKPTALFRVTGDTNQWQSSSVFQGGYSLDLMESWE